MKVYLDDVRLPDEEGWVRVTTPKEVIDLLRKGKVEALSLDHDLGEEETIGSGYDVLTWLEEEVALHGFVPPAEIRVHSANAPARLRMEQAIRNIKRISARGGSHRS